ncbi:MAG TPA: hypothetical protein VL049_30415 [Candidatus Dormibacteraeota bacterium]|nr:hypothetical protein [Candidatus Dormibacteraeota bacterium]
MSVRSLVRFALAAFLLAIPRLAGAVCTAADITAVDPSCPAGTGACTISGNYTVNDGCTLDFGARNIGLTGKLTVANVVSQIPDQAKHVGTMTLRAGNLSLAQSGFIDAVGQLADETGGVVIIEVTGAFTTAPSSHIEVTGKRMAGTIIVRAGTIGVAGRLLADFQDSGAAGGVIDLTANGDLTLSGTSTVSARGGSDSDGGGEIDRTAGGNQKVQTELRVDGSDGGFHELRAEGAIEMADANASGGGDAGSGGCIDITGGAGTTITGTIVADGATGSFMTGGCGGLICLDGDSGTMTIDPSATVSANGASPDGGGGEISLLGLGSTVVRGTLEARGPMGGLDFGTCGGDVCIDTGLDATVNATGNIDVSGSDAGGAVEIIAGRNVTIDGKLDLRGREQGALGGDAALRAGNAGAGQLSLTNTIDASSAPTCGDNSGCGQGGSTDLFGCDVTVTIGSSLIATGPDGGQHDIAAREQLRVQGKIDATRTVATGNDGVTRIQHTARKPPNLGGASILPAPQVQALATCPTQGPTMPSCLDPCPTCGNGQIEFPETCDLGVMPPTSCHGCSVFCQLENCNDNLTCTGDQCLLDIGCRHRVTPVCTEPPTPTPTVTGTLPTATSTATPSATRTATDTPSATATPLASATGSATVTTTPTASLTATAVASATPLDTATATATATSAPPACAGDCNGDGSVAVNELITGVNIALGNSTVANCRSFDRNGDGSVSINELIAAVNAALNGC